MTYTNDAARIADAIAASEHAKRDASPNKAYTVTVLHMNGWGTSRVSVPFKSRAKTWSGLIRATGTAIARALHDDCIEVESLFRGENTFYRLTFADEHAIWRATQDALFNIMY